MILAGDIGGTKTHLCLFEGEGGSLRRVREQIFASASFSSLSAVITAFGGGRPLAVEAACFGVAGPVVARRATLPNLDWQPIDADALAVELAVPSVALINDLVATAEGVSALPPSSWISLQEGHGEARGPQAVIAAGTGLGMAVRVPAEGGVVILPSEGGHVDFAARDEAEWSLLQTLRARFGRVSVERVVSGPGLGELYAWLRDSGLAAEQPDVRAALAEGDPGPVISAAAAEGRCALCEAAMARFTSLYGAVAGNLALMSMATGGVWVGGGIAPKNVDRMRDGTFLGSFLDKGRYRPLLEGIPVRLILDQQTALLGAAVVAQRRDRRQAMTETKIPVAERPVTG